MHMYNSPRSPEEDIAGLHDSFPLLWRNSRQRETALLRQLRADWPRGTRVAGRMRATGEVFTGRVKGHHTLRPDLTALPEHPRVVRPTLTMGPIVACDDGIERRPGAESLHRIPALTARQHWALAVAHRNGGFLADPAGLLGSLATHDRSGWRLTRAGAFLARALAPTAPLPRLGPRQMRALAALQAEGGVVTYHASLLRELGIAANADVFTSLLRRGMIEALGQQVVLTEFGEQALASAPLVGDLLVKALSERGLTGQVSCLSGGAEAVVVEVNEGQILACGRTTSRISHHTWAHEGVDVYLAPTDGGDWEEVHASRTQDAEADVRECVAAIARFTQRAHA